jgi:hypothetical protein
MACAVNSDPCRLQPAFPLQLAPMKTPITDHASDHSDAFESPAKAREFARRLELDRAALMDALCEIHILSHDYSGEGSIALKAIEAARANFPNA